MTVVRYLEVLAASAGFIAVALALGETLLRLVERAVTRFAPGDHANRAPSPTRFGAAALAGFGGIGCVGVVLGLAHAFHWATLLAAGVLIVVACRSALMLHLRWLAGWRDAGEDVRRDAVVLIALAVAGAGWLLYWLIALQPPTESDALAYHLPEAEYIVEHHHLPATLLGHWQYGNLPKLGEVVWAQGLAFVDYGFASTLHMTIVGAFLVFAFGMVRDLWGARPAAVAVAAIALYPELMRKASTPYVDGMVVAFEVAALLCVASWVQRGRAEHLGWAAILLGFGLATKYSVGPTALFVSVVVGVTLWRRLDRPTALKLAATLAALATAAGGFWYLKNLVRFGNPAYPLYFGHDGVSDATYESAIDGIRMFGPRTLSEFVLLPERLADVVSAPAFLSFFLAPFALLVPRARAASRVLLVYFALYVPYWFFIASHQLRFLVPAMAAGIILASAVAVAALERLPARVFQLAAAGAVALFAAAVVSVGAAEVQHRAAIPDSFPRFQLGAMSDDEHLAGQLGCSYTAIAFLRDRDMDGRVADHWTTWHGVSIGPYAQHNPLVTVNPRPGESPQAAAERSGVRFVYVDESLKRDFFASSDPFAVEYRKTYGPREEALLRASRQVWQDDDCRLYELGTAA